VQSKSSDARGIVIEFPSAKTISHEGRIFQIEWNELADDRRWDDFVLAQPDAHHEQTSLWGNVRASTGWTVLRVVMEERGVIVGGAQMLLRSFRRLIRWAYVTYGPCIAGDDPLVEEVLLTGIKNHLRHLGALYLIAILPYGAQRSAERMPARGFIRPPRAIAPFYIRATLVIDTSKSDERLLSEMRASTRHQVRQGMRRGLTFVPGGEADLDTFWELMVALCARRKTTPNPSHPDFFRELWKQFSPRGWISLFLVKHQGKPVAAALAFPFGDWFRVWKIGWSGKHAELRPNQLLWWEMIRHARSKGFRHFDFVNVDLAQPADSSSADPPVPLSDGPTGFKLGFGGSVKILPGAYCYFLSPLARAATRFGLVRLLNSESCVRLARKMWSRR
jgi:lipid II:glycine glycyltransferase (peptidoglycan interpeptide bridge formation enzyme)